MKLEKYVDKGKKKRKIVLISFGLMILICVSFMLYKTFASFTENVEFPMMNGKVDYFGNSDIYFVFYKDKKLIDEMPKKENTDNIVFDYGECDNGAEIVWNEEEWAPLVKNLTTIKTKCNLYFKTEYREKILNGAVPKLSEKLIPITISESELPSGVTYTNESKKYSGKVTKADIKTEWYSYANKNWANAVKLKDGEEDNYNIGQEIPEEKIESYFVWIPRYRYRLFAKDPDSYIGYANNFGQVRDNQTVPKTGKETEIEIQFETNKDEIAKGSKEGEWLTHPAFTSFESNGFWVGKFETSYKNEKTDSVSPENIIIKPLQHTWDGMHLANAFYSGYKYLRELDSHILKNSEWGAIAYLTNSKYGRCDENECKMVYNNNNTELTGNSANYETTCGIKTWDSNATDLCNKQEGFNAKIRDGSYGYSYYNPLSGLASTTGNHSGIFDLSGDRLEHIMGVMEYKLNTEIPASGRDSNANSGFNGPYTNEEGQKEDGLSWPDKKYYDIYQYNEDSTNFSLGHLGDATKELGPFYRIQYSYNGYFGSLVTISGWYSGLQAVLTKNVPLIRRGGSFIDGTDGGIFSFNGYTGKNNLELITFRVVLSP